MRTMTVTTVTAVLTAALASAALGERPGDGLPEKFTAFAVDISNTAPRANTTPVDFAITRWSANAERDRLIAAFHEKGQNGLLDALQKLPVIGYFNTPGSLRYDLHFARERPEPDGGQMIFLMTDRYIRTWEAFNQTRTLDYPFTLIQLKVDKDGNGVGKASIATKITQDRDGTIVLENFSSEPVMLNGVHKVK